MADVVKIAVFGAAGRMGREIIDVVREDPATLLVAAIEREGHDLLDSEAGCDDVRYSSPSSSAIEGCDVLVAFSDASAAHVATGLAVDADKSLVIGTTGMGQSEQLELDEAARKVAVLVEPNMSVGINVLGKLVAEAASRLKGWDVEIMEIHHRHKVDAPSGTAMRLHELAVEARGGKDSFSGDRVSRHQARPDDEIGHAVMRGGDVVGEHSVFLVGQGERIELVHRATSRRNFAAGAVFAAKALVGKPPGKYKLEDLLASS